MQSERPQGLAGYRQRKRNQRLRPELPIAIPVHTRFGRQLSHGRKADPLPGPELGQAPWHLFGGNDLRRRGRPIRILRHRDSDFISPKFEQ